jgi:hypothetical protein
MLSSTLNGTSHSITVFPTVTSIFPSSGSLAGGTTVSVKGMGLSHFASELVVYVGGVACDVTSSDFTSLTCVTRPRLSLADSIVKSSNLQSITSLSSMVDLLQDNISTLRSQGSPGWWVKMWNANNYYAGNVGKHDRATLSFGWHRSFTLSMFNIFGGDRWATNLGFSTNNLFYVHDAASIFIAPYTGMYTFYVGSDDVGKLYGSTKGVSVNEVLLAHNPSYVATMGNFYQYPSQISLPVALKRGQKYYLRYRNVGNNIVI